MGGSKGIYIFHKNESGFYTTRQNVKFEENFLVKIGEKNDYIIQAGIIQDRELSRIYPNSVNTCRIITENIDGSAHVRCAMLRTGCGQNDVDNVSAGGLCVKIDIASGRWVILPCHMIIKNSADILIQILNFGILPSQAGTKSKNLRQSLLQNFLFLLI